MKFDTFLLLLCLNFESSTLKPVDTCTRQYDNDVETHVCKNISEIFPPTTYNSYHFKCLDCNITVFSNDTFPFQNKFISLNVSHSGIQKITKRAFSGLSRTQKIFLEHNEISEIASEAFWGLREVQEVHLEFNNLINIHAGFVENFSVVTLNMSHNKIWRLPNKAFRGVSNILNLDLGNNRIRRINGSSLYGLETLQNLTLESNKICHLPVGMFKYVTNLKNLNLAKNRLSKLTLDSFSGLKFLKILNLAHNFVLNSLTQDVFVPFFKRLDLDISANGISNLNFPAAVLALKVERLVLDDNLFVCSDLTDIFEEMKNGKRDIVSHVRRFHVKNINGIACTSVKFGPNRENLQEVFRYFLEKAEEEAKIVDTFAC